MIFDPGEMVRVLDRYGVEYVLIGGLAAALHGSDMATTDLDITPDRRPSNLDALSAALRDLEARIRVDGIEQGLPFEHDGASLARAFMWNLRTRAGDLDIAFVPLGTNGFDELAASSGHVTVSGTRIRLASLDDVIRSKAAADRPKDRLALVQLRDLARRRGTGG